MLGTGFWALENPATSTQPPEPSIKKILILNTNYANNYHH
jgi:hypothetical protein